MKRSLMGVVGALSIVAIASAASAQNVAEVHVFMTDLGSSFNMAALDGNNDGRADGTLPTLPAPLPTTNPKVTLMPGEMTTLGIWLMPTRGNITATNVTKVLSGGVGAWAFSSNGGLNGSANWYSDSALSSPTAGDTFNAPAQGGAGANANIAGSFQLMAPGGFNSAVGYDMGSGPIFLGALKVMVPNTAVANDSLKIHLSTGARVWTTNGTQPAGTNWTMGFGFDGANPDFRRFDTTGQINASAATTLQLGSFVADAEINVIPEPATMGLLALGALALRRRRMA